MIEIHGYWSTSNGVVIDRICRGRHSSFKTATDVAERITKAIADAVVESGVPERVNFSFAIEEKN